MTTLVRICSIAILSAVLAAGCAARGVRIAELQDRPDKYERKTVSVEGVWKGAIPAEVTVVSDIAKGCDLIFPAKSKVLFMAKLGEEGRLWIYLCSGTQKIGKKTLGKMKAKFGVPHAP